MRLIFYEDAAYLLSIEVDTLKHAIKRGVLTRAGRQGRKMCLFEDQVRLFVGVNPRTGHKKRLSFEALTPDEKHQWDELSALARIPNTEQETSIEQLEEIIDQRVTTQLEPLRKALEGMFNSPPKREEVPQGRPFLKVRVGVN